MLDAFEFDVFLSHNSLDKHIVRPLAERLRADGLRVWFDEWEIPKGAPIPGKVEQGLEQSRILLLCMSANAFASDWASLEAQSYRFRDPINKSLSFLTLRLDGAKLTATLAPLNYIDWREPSELAYQQLLSACGFAPSLPLALRGGLEFAALAHAWPHKRDGLQLHFIDKHGNEIQTALCSQEAKQSDSFILRVQTSQPGQLALFCQSNARSFVQLHPNPLSAARLRANTLPAGRYQLPGEICKLPDASLGMSMKRLHFTEQGRECVLAFHAPQLPHAVRSRQLLHALNEQEMREILHALWQTDAAALAMAEVDVRPMTP